VATDSDVLAAVDGLARGPWSLRRSARELEELARRLGGGGPGAEDDAAIRRALLAGFPDRVARRRAAGSSRLVLSAGTGAVLGRESGVRSGDLLLALDVVGRTDAEALVRSASRVERDWLQPTHSDVVHRLDEEKGAVRATERRWYRGLILEERAVAPDPAEAAEVLAEALGRKGLGADFEGLLRRAAFAGVDLDADAVLARACLGRTRLSEVDLPGAVPRAVLAAIEGGAPRRLRLPSGRHASLQYREDGSVFTAVRLQELFGLGETPRVGPRAVPVVFELLAPNGRPVQTTTDLHSFWTRGYPEVRRELRGRYPKHPWPEDPWSAEPTHRAKRRR
jgi:ATP-dependent helicase HrpB